MSLNSPNPVTILNTSYAELLLVVDPPCVNAGFILEPEVLRYEDAVAYLHLVQRQIERALLRNKGANYASLNFRCLHGPVVTVRLVTGANVTVTFKMAVFDGAADPEA